MTGSTLGTDAAIVPITIMATVVIARVVEQNLVAVDHRNRRSGTGRGRARRIACCSASSSPRRSPPEILGYTFMFIAVVDMSAMAGYIGGGGLGNFAIIYGYQQFNQQATWVTVAIIVVNRAGRPADRQRSGAPHPAPLTAARAGVARAAARPRSPPTLEDEPPPHLRPRWLLGAALVLHRHRAN